MTSRRARLSYAEQKELRAINAELGPLFDRPVLATATEVGLSALERSAAKNDAAIRALIPLATDLAHAAGPEGVTVSDLREAAVSRGLLPEAGTGRSLSYLGAVMRRAGLVNTGVARRASLLVTHGNRHTVWRVP